MGAFFALLSIGSMITFQSLNVYGNFFLTFWTDDELLKNQSLSGTQEYYNRNIYYLVVYSILGLIQGKKMQISRNLLIIEQVFEYRRRYMYVILENAIFSIRVYALFYVNH